MCIRDRSETVELPHRGGERAEDVGNALVGSEGFYAIIYVASYFAARMAKRRTLNQYRLVCTVLTSSFKGEAHYSSYPYG